MHIDDVKEYFLECFKLKQSIRTSSMFVGITLSVCLCLVLFLLIYLLSPVSYENFFLGIFDLVRYLLLLVFFLNIWKYFSSRA
ncbi:MULTISPECIES: hypothetical protein [Aerococcus]|uniref:Uncharacterized protein n=1 Tax=Aerococcus sanguinicola TaxID=119206 RepID=A0A5N1GTJ5_9LACT|nr:MULTISPECIES: hypothetical protein [Aerococcus]KAA9301930.1 hypothetical protein F6I03_01615 [Aerococcus sanguinicola]MDK6368647.1 hypothetical protein [Aerococcus sp. UMB9870]MDK6679730.1 hypothetical protein [Aerococcus sp. UMB8608]MDK6685998.1 hypothetical protein [Aerococcus sp. UMB8623]MDK6940804.1 hypothetical protein [Aerococcus sp. UMB8487]